MGKDLINHDDIKTFTVNTSDIGMDGEIKIMGVNTRL